MTVVLAPRGYAWREGTFARGEISTGLKYPTWSHGVVWSLGPHIIAAYLMLTISPTLCYSRPSNFAIRRRGRVSPSIHRRLFLARRFHF